MKRQAAVVSGESFMKLAIGDSAARRRCYNLLFAFLASPPPSPEGVKPLAFLTRGGCSGHRANNIIY